MSSKKLEGALQLLSSLIKTPSCSPTSSLAHRPRLPVFLLLDPPSTLLQLLPSQRRVILQISRLPGLVMAHRNGSPRRQYRFDTPDSKMVLVFISSSSSPSWNTPISSILDLLHFISTAVLFLRLRRHTSKLHRHNDPVIKSKTECLWLW